MQLPNFIIIGAAKCGTTALWYNLDKHPKITMASKSQSSIEMNFWKSISYRKGINWYKSRFQGDLCGEKSTVYYAQKKCMKEIHKQIPECKLLLCLRNPVDRAFSNFQMNAKAGKVSSFSFQLFKRRYASAGAYFTHIKNNILPFFDKDQIHICICEYMKQNTKKEMNKVFDFLDVEQLDLPSKKVDGQILKNRTRQEDIKANHKEKFYRVWSKQKETLSGPMRKQLLEFYKNHNDRLFRFLEYEIKEWRK